MVILVAVLAAGMFAVRTEQQWAALQQAARYHGERERASLQMAVRMKRQAAGLAQQRAGREASDSETGPIPEDFERCALFYQSQAAYYGRLKCKLLRSWW
jgi:hypothetical protein